MITKKQAKAYSAISLDLLYKMKVKIDPKTLTDFMDLMYDLYDPKEAVDYYKKIISYNKILANKIKGRAYCYIINFHNTDNIQFNMIKKFCGDIIKLGKVYKTMPGENSDIYYELIKDIRKKEMDMLIMSIFTLYSMSEAERDMIIHLCRRNQIIFVEV